MNPEERKEIVQEAFFEVIEQMAYTFGDPADAEEVQNPTGELWQASMSFAGPMEGRLVLAAPASACAVLAENMLGVDPEDERAQDKARDALKELLNVTCGSVLTRVAGDEPVFDLSVPEVVVLDEEAWSALVSAEDSAITLVEDEPALVQLVLVETGQ